MLHLSLPLSSTCAPPGWYGHDCSRKVAGQKLDEGRIQLQPWLKNVAVQPVASLPVPPAPTRKRPLIFVWVPLARFPLVSSLDLLFACSGMI
jgi:hypothetical protein